MNNRVSERHTASQTSVSIQRGEPELSPRQKDIYRNLKAIGPEIAAFYLDGIRILQNNDLETAANLLGHIAREIDGGLRDVLSEKREEELKFVIRAPDGNKSIYEKGKEGSFKFASKAPGTVKVTYNRIGKHKASILQSLGIEDFSPLAERWLKVTAEFYKFVHRHGAWKSPLDREIFEPLWYEFEDVLAELVGSYFNLLGRVDTIRTYEQPTEEIIETLHNLLASRARYTYFFRNLEFPAWLKPLREAGWFDPEKNLDPQEIPDQPGHYRVPVWCALEYVEKMANHPERPLDILIDILNANVNYTDEHGKRIENYRTDWRLIKVIGTLPVDRIEHQHIAFMSSALAGKWGGVLIAQEISQTILPKFLDENAKELSLTLLEVMLNAKVDNKRIVAAMDEYWLGKALKTHEKAIARLCGVQAAQITFAKIRDCIDKGIYSFGFIATVGSNFSNAPYKNYAKSLVGFAGKLLQFALPDTIEETVSALLQEGLAEDFNDYKQKEARAIFGRIALNTIAHHYEDLKHLFWEWDGNPLEELRFKSAIYRLICTHCFTFDEAEFDQILHWVDSYQSGTSQKDDEEQLKIEALKKREWLSALMETCNEKVVAAYRKYEQINPAQIEQPGLSSYTKISPKETCSVTAKDLSSMSNAEIAEYLDNFKEEAERSSSVEDDLAQTLVKYVETHPERITDDLLPFRDIHGVYQYWILQGFLAAWRSKRDFDWTALLEFVCQILSSERFWVESNRQYRNWILSTTADLITSGTVDDEHALDGQLLPVVEQILLILVEVVEPSIFALKNLPSAVLNSDRSKVFSAMVNYALRFARMHDAKQKDVRWPQAIRADFNKRLDRSIESSFGFSYTLGRYLPNLLYLDQEWVIENINCIFLRQDEYHWQAAFSGYLVSSHKIYKNLYSLLKENGHYQRALRTDFDNQDMEALVAHICVGWIEDWETLQDETSLVYQLINSGSPDVLAAVVDFFWRQKEIISGEAKSKVGPTWRALFQVLTQNSDKLEFQKVLGELSRWLTFIDRIEEETLVWLKLSAKYIDQDSGFNTPFFVEALLEHAPKTPKEVGVIYIEMLVSNVYPDYPQDRIQETVSLLYSHGYKTIADQICNLYGEAGFDFLRPLYEKHQVDYTPTSEEQAATRLAQVREKNKHLHPLIEKALGKPNSDVKSLTAEEIQKLLLEEGIEPGDNLFSRAIIEEREK